MCNDHGPTRRDVLHGGAALAAAAVLARRGSRPGRPVLRQVRRSAGPIGYGGATAYSMAMHIHSSFSEQSGSMDAQLFQAARNAVDVVWWTDHDHRMDGLGYASVMHFTGTSEAGWNWVGKHSTGLKGSAAQFVSSPSSPNDPVAGGSMYLAAAAKAGVSSAYAGLYANTKPAGWNIRDNINGQSLSVDVLLNTGWARGYLELLISSSYHPAGGFYTLSYRMVPRSGPVTRAASGSLGIITVPVSSPWQTVTVTPEQDIAAIWPSVDPRDFALWDLQLNAVSTGDAVSGYFDYLRFSRTLTGGELFAQQQDMMAALAASYPGVTQRQGLEVSRELPHLNWFGGSNLAVPTYAGVANNAKAYLGYVQKTIIPQIHQGGGLASYNHPYGYADGPAQSQSAQDALLSQLAATLIANKVIGCDLLEVGYNLRQGVDLAHHIGLWDVLSRHALFVTGNGTSDDHFGQNWAGLQNNWVSAAWSASTGQADLLAALAAGRSWCGAISYAGALDMLVDGSVPMGSVSVSGVSSRNLQLTATGLPSGGSAQLVQGTVDYAGSTPDTVVAASWTDTELAAGGGQASTAADTTAESFIRPQVLDAAGNVIATGNPVWLLHNTPPGGIPAPRQT
jgi:hypothetical protein